MASSGSFNTTSYSGRYLVLSWSQKSQSIVNNTTTITWSLKGAGSASGWYYAQNFTVVIDGKTVYKYTIDDGQVELGNGTVVASGDLTIKHNSDGKRSFTASVSAGIYNWSPNCSGSGSFTLNPIARVSTLTASNGVLGTAQTLTVNRQDSSLTHTIEYRCGAASGYIASEATTSTSIKWTPPMSLASQNTSGTTVSVTLTIKTYSGNTCVGSSSKAISCAIPESAKPSCAFTVTDTTGYASSYGNGDFVQGLSRLKVDISPTLAYGSPIKSYKTNINGVMYTSNPVEVNVATANSLKIAVIVVDSRGRSSTEVTKEIAVVEYSKPKLSKVSICRSDDTGIIQNDGDYAAIAFSFSFTEFLSQKSNNDWAYKVEYKKASENSWSSDIVSLKNYHSGDETYIFEADTGSTYSVKLSLTDGLMTTTQTLQLSTASVILHFRSDGTGMGIGKISENENALDIGWNTYHYGGIYYKDSNDNTIGPLGQNKVLWSTTNGWVMNASQTATLSEKISAQSTGIVLVFRDYDYTSGTPTNSGIYTHFVPKYIITDAPSWGHNISWAHYDGSYFITKYLYIGDIAITGAAINEKDQSIKTPSGITVTPKKSVLWRVIGV